MYGTLKKTHLIYLTDETANVLKCIYWGGALLWFLLAFVVYPQSI